MFIDSISSTALKLILISWVQELNGTQNWNKNNFQKQITPPVSIFRPCNLKHRYCSDVVRPWISWRGFIPIEKAFQNRTTYHSRVVNNQVLQTPLQINTIYGSKQASQRKHFWLDNCSYFHLTSSFVDILGTVWRSRCGCLYIHNNQTFTVKLNKTSYKHILLFDTVHLTSVHLLTSIPTPRQCIRRFHGISFMIILSSFLYKCPVSACKIIKNGRTHCMFNVLYKTFAITTS